MLDGHIICKAHVFLAEIILLENILFPALIIKEGRNILKVSMWVAEWKRVSYLF